jgi:hypothetical protein
MSARLRRRNADGAAINVCVAASDGKYQSAVDGSLHETFHPTNGIDCRGIKS